MLILPALGRIAVGVWAPWFTEQGPGQSSRVTSLGLACFKNNKE